MILPINQYHLRVGSLHQQISTLKYLVTSPMPWVTKSKLSYIMISDKQPVLGNVNFVIFITITSTYATNKATTQFYNLYIFSFQFGITVFLDFQQRR